MCALLLLQWAHRRRPFILAWAAGWLVLAPMSLVLVQPYTSKLATNLAIGISQLLRIVTGALFFWSADLYRHSKFVRLSRWRWAAGVTAWFVIAPMLVGPAAVSAPGFLISAVLLAGAGAMYAAVLLERRMIGAGLVSLVLFGVAISNLTQAFAADMSADFNFQVFMLTTEIGRAHV